MPAIAFTPEHRKYVSAFAYRALRRAQGAGAKSLQFEDVFQELMIAWCAARDKWQEDRGVPFLAFLQLGMQKAINRFLNGQIQHGQNLSMDYSGEDDGGSFSDRVPDENALNAIETFEQDDHRDAVIRRMSERTRTFIELLRDPPQFMIDGVTERRQRREFAKRTGLPLIPESSYLTAAMIFDFMGVTASQRAQIYAELKRLGHAG